MKCGEICINVCLPYMENVQLSDRFAEYVKYSSKYFFEKLNEM